MAAELTIHEKFHSFAALGLGGLLLLASLFLIEARVLAEQPTHGSVTLQLKWFNQFQFAGFYAAKEKGFYRDAGLDVEIVSHRPGMDNLQAVASGQADFGVSGPELLLERMNGAPLVALAVVMQHSAYAIMAKADSGIATPHDLLGKRIMLTKKGGADIWAMLRNEGVREEQLIFPNISWDLANLVNGDVDAIVTYVTDMPPQMRHLGVPFTLILPRTYGVDFYGDTIFTSKSFLRKRPGAVAAFRAASLRGWEYAMAHPGEMVQLIMDKYPTNRTRAQLEYESATLRHLIMPDIVPVGHMNSGRWEYMAETFAALAMAPPIRNLDDFIYNPGEASSGGGWLLGTLGIAVAALALAGWLLFFNARLKSAVRKRTLELSTLNLELTREIGVREEVEFALRDSEETIRAMSNASLDPMVMIEDDGTVSFWNSAAERVFGYTEDEAMGRDVHALIAPDEFRERISIGMQSFSVTGQGRVVGKTLELIGRRKDGGAIPVEIAVAAFRHGGSWRAVGVIRDITARKRTEEKLREMAITDSLTGVSNRRHFMYQATQEVERSRRYDRMFSLIMLDIDHFKSINDTHGHDTGDKVLVTFVELVRMELRQNDLLARFGGEEFVALLPETDLEGGVHVAERIRKRVEGVRLGDGEKSLSMTVSAGVAVYSEEYAELEPLIKKADQALYRAKEGGRNRVEAAE